MALEHRAQRSPLNYFAVGIAVVAIIIALFALFRPTPSSTGNGPLAQESSLERSKRERKLRVGYGPFPPYTIIDPNETDPNKSIRGLCIDMVNEIAARQTPPWQVEWHKVSWESLRADMYSGEFDFIANAIYPTVPRAPDFLFSEPFTYLGVGVGIVRSNENRIQNFEDLNKPGITVSLAEGWTATEYARRVLDRERLLVKPIGDDVNAQLNDLLLGRADAVLQDAPVALSYLKAYPNQVKLLWLDQPPMLVGASFVTRWGDTEMIDFLNTSIRTLQSDGTMEQLDRKWKGMGLYPVLTLKPGAGLKPEG